MNIFFIETQKERYKIDFYTRLIYTWVCIAQVCVCMGGIFDLF